MIAEYLPIRCFRDQDGHLKERYEGIPAVYLHSHEQHLCPTCANHIEQAENWRLYHAFLYICGEPLTCARCHQPIHALAPEVGELMQTLSSAA